MTEPTAGQLHAAKVAEAVQSGEDPRSVLTDDPVGDKTLAYWTCEVGPVVRAALPDGADFPMRQGVRAVFRALAGFEPARLSSGWGRWGGARERALIEFWEAHWAIEVGISNFDLHNAAVERMKLADEAVREALGRYPVALVERREEGQ